MWSQQLLRTPKNSGLYCLINATNVTKVGSVRYKWRICMLFFRDKVCGKVWPQFGLESKSWELNYVILVSGEAVWPAIRNCTVFYLIIQTEKNISNSAFLVRLLPWDILKWWSTSFFSTNNCILRNSKLMLYFMFLPDSC